MSRLLLISFFVFFMGAVQAAEQKVSELRVAVAANFKSVLDVLAERFSEQYKHKVIVSSASSGALYNQLIHGAPYDLFLSADSRRPAMLEKSGLTLADSRQPYAIGRLVLWNKTGKPIQLSELGKWQGKLAIANPDTAPYGLAAREVLEKLGIWKTFKSRIVQGNSIQQTWLFVDSGNVSLGMVAWSQLVDKTDEKGISFIPDDYYQPIRQELVVLKNARNAQMAKQFSDYLLSEPSQQYIKEHGYGAVTLRQRTQD